MFREISRCSRSKRWLVRALTDLARTSPGSTPACRISLYWNLERRQARIDAFRIRAPRAANARPPLRFEMRRVVFQVFVGNTPVSVEFGEAGIAVIDAMRHRFAIQSYLR